MQRGLKEAQERAQFVSILADGLFHMKSEEGAEGAIKREFKKSDGEEVVVWEKLYEELVGQIVGIDTREQEFGTMLYITLNVGTDEDPNNLVISVGAGNNFGVEILKKIPNIDLTKDVQISPYVIEKENGKVGKYVVIKQGTEKVASYFQEGSGKDTKDINGFPIVDEEKLKESSAKGEKSRKLFWTTYFTEIEIFLVDYIMTNHRLVAESQKVEEAEDDATKDSFEADVEAPSKPGMQKPGKENTLAEDAEEVMAEQDAEEKKAAESK